MWNFNSNYVCLSTYKKKLRVNLTNTDGKVTIKKVNNCSKWLCKFSYYLIVKLPYSSAYVLLL